MRLPRRSLVLATTHFTALRDIPARAQAAGLHRLWTTEFQGRDAVLRAGAFGSGTQTLRVGTGIAYAFTRTPRALAAAALDAQELTGGRLTLGLGAGTRGLRRAYGVEDFDPPATRLASVLAELRSIWADPSWRRDVPPPSLAAAGVNEVMLSVAAHHADRVLFHPLCLVEPHLHERVLPGIERGQGRRDGAPATLSAWCITSVDADAALARERARMQLAFYLSTPGYRSVVDGTPWEASATSVREGFTGPDTDWATLARHIPDDLLDQVAIVGDRVSAPRAADQMARRLADLGVDEMVFQAVDSGTRAQDVATGLNLLIDTLAPQARSTTDAKDVP